MNLPLALIESVGRRKIYPGRKFYFSDRHSMGVAPPWPSSFCGAYPGLTSWASLLRAFGAGIFQPLEVFQPLAGRRSGATSLRWDFFCTFIHAIAIPHSHKPAVRDWGKKTGSD